MDPTLARYPFREAAREAVTESGSSIEEILGTGGRSAAVDRALDRIDRSLASDTVGPPHRDPEVELLSYPLARIIVSLVDDPRVTSRYVRAEGRTAAERFEADRDRGETDGFVAGFDAAFAEFDVAVRDLDGAPAVAVLDYLPLARELPGDGWRLVNRQLADGWISVGEDELSPLLEAAVRRRVGRDLPLPVPEAMAERLADAVAEVEAAVGGVHLPEALPDVDPAAFPPCMVHLVERVESGESLPPTARYALAGFLTSIGLAPDELDRAVGPPLPDDLTAMAAAVVGDDGPTQFPPGSCETMVAYGDCVNQDDLCARIEHPLEYYAERLAEGGR